MLSSALTIVAWLLSWLTQVYLLIVFLSALFTMIPVDPNHPVVRFIRKCTEPVLSPLRARCTVMEGRLDLSPLVVIFVLVMVQRWLVPQLIAYAKLVQN